MKRSVRLAILAAVLFILLIVVRITGMLQYYKIPTPANEPTINVGDWVFASTLKNVLPYKFVVVTSEYADSLNSAYTRDFRPGSHYLYRLCGTEGDVLEMKNGVLWVNHKNFDEGLNLNIQYKIINKEFYLIAEEDINPDISEFLIMGDSAMVTFDNLLLKKYQSKLHLVPFIITDTTNGPFKWLDKNSTWTPDNFGPLKVPATSCFVLGDNRHNALDSRYIGFIKKENIKGVVLNK